MGVMYGVNNNLQPFVEGMIIITPCSTGVIWHLINGTLVQLYCYTLNHIFKHFECVLLNDNDIFYTKALIFNVK